MIEEMRAQQSLSMYILRGPAGLSLLQPTDTISACRRSHFAMPGAGVPSERATAERLMPQLAALSDEALTGLFCVALERRPWLRGKVIRSASCELPEDVAAMAAPSPADVPRPV